PIDTFADLGRVYTPGVGEVCRRIYEDPSLADHYTIIANTIAIISDGSAVLGLGNLGPLAAMPILEGKAALLAHLVGVNAFPIARSLMHYTGNSVLGADRLPEAIELLVASGGTASDIEEICGKCDVVIATTGQPALIEPSMVRPGQFIFALSNPRPEIDATAAMEAGARIAEGGAAINNLLCYPGACRGLLDAGAKSAPQAAFEAA